MKINKLLRKQSLICIFLTLNCFYTSPLNAQIFGGGRCVPWCPEDTLKPPSGGGFTGYKTNKFDKKNQVAGGGWIVVWGDDMSETDVASGLVAAGVSIYSSNSQAFLLWVEAMVDKTIYKITDNIPSAVQNEAEKLAMDVIFRAIRGESATSILRSYDTVDFKAGAIKYSGGNYAAGVKVSTTWGMKPYVAFRVRSSSSKSNASNSQPRNFNNNSNSFNQQRIEQKRLEQERLENQKIRALQAEREKTRRKELENRRLLLERELRIEEERIRKQRAIEREALERDKERSGWDLSDW